MKVFANLMRVAVLITVSCLTLIGCGKSTNSGKDGSIPGGSHLFKEGTDINGSYRFTEKNGSFECTTEKQTYTSGEEHCGKLADDSINHGCALTLRQIEFANVCPGMPWPTKATPAQTSAPQKPVAPDAPAASTNSHCYNPDLLAPKGPEIAFETFIDGLGGIYRMTAMNEMVQYTEGDQKTSLSVSVTAATDENLLQPATTQAVTCKDLSQAPDGEMNAGFHEPVVIQRASGSLSGSVDTKLDAYGKTRMTTDDLETSIASNFSESSLRSLQQTLAKSDLELHVYKIDAGTYQIIISGKTEQGIKKYEVLASVIYAYQATSAPPAQAPVSALPAPAAPAEGTAAAIAGICNHYNYTDDKVNCLAKFKNVSIQPKVVSVCDSYNYTDDKVNCLEKFKQKAILDDLVQICEKYNYNDDKVACLQKFEGINLDKAVIATCDQYNYMDDKVSCILKLKP